MSIVLDVGSQQMRSLRREGGRLVGRKNHAVYLSLADKPAQRRILDKASIRYATCADSLLVIGQAAIEAADMLEEPCIPLMQNSRLPQSDPVARQVLTTLVDCLLPPPRKPRDVCWINVAGTADGNSAEQRFFTQILRLKDYTPRIVPPGMAIVLAELGSNGFSGLGCDFGHSGTRTSFAYHAVEHFSTSIEKGGHWIDSRVAESEGCILWDSEGNQYLNTAAITRWKESSLISVFKPISEREQKLSLLCEEVIGDTLAFVARQLSGDRTTATISEPLPIVCGGGLSRLPGFRELLLEMVRDAKLPIEISEIRGCTDPDYTVARGCLILDELDQSAVPCVA